MDLKRINKTFTQAGNNSKQNSQELLENSLIPRCLIEMLQTPPRPQSIQTQVIQQL